MADEIGNDQVKLRVHGDSGTNDRVRARVFGRQITSLVKALEAADKAANGGTRYDYVISELKNESASAVLTQVVSSSKPRQHSSVYALGEAVNAVMQLNKPVIERYSDCVPHLAKLAVGAKEQFSHTDLRISGFKPFRIDEFFVEQVARAMKLAVPAEERFYEGIAIGSFDGIIKEVDLRGDTPRLKLILSAGGKELDCVCNDLSTDELRQALDRRVSVVARAHYNGETGLPARLEILSIKIIKADPDLMRWRGGFNGLRSEDWGDTD